MPTLCSGCHCRSEASESVAIGPSVAMVIPPVAAKSAGTPKPPGTAAAKASDAVPQEAAVAVPPVSAAAGLHVTGGATSTVTAGARPKVPPMEELNMPDTEVLDEKTVRLAAGLVAGCGEAEVEVDVPGVCHRQRLLGALLLRDRLRLRHGEFLA